MHDYFQMAPAVNIYAHEYPTTLKYHMLPTHLWGEISTEKNCFFYNWKLWKMQSAATLNTRIVSDLSNARVDNFKMIMD